MPSDPQQLVLQVFPRADPARAVTYAGDQVYIRRILRDLAHRLEGTRGSAPSTRGALEVVRGELGDGREGDRP